MTAFKSSIEITQPQIDLKGQDCERILRALPQWFGIEEALQDYIIASQNLPTVFTLVDKQVAGFLTVKHHNPYASEIYVMGVHPSYHRQGIGKAMVQHIETLLKAQGVEFLQVKTLSPSHPDPNYVLTRKFYDKMGFRPLEEFPTLWGESNPCLLMIKSL